jgi:hypothetical protein
MTVAGKAPVLTNPERLVHNTTSIFKFPVILSNRAHALIARQTAAILTLLPRSEAETPTPTTSSTGIHAAGTS